MIDPPLYQTWLVAMWVLYPAFFIVSLLLAARRKQRGFKILPVFAGIWLVCWAVPVSWQTNHQLLGQALALLFPVGLLVGVAAFADLFVSGSKR